MKTSRWFSPLTFGLSAAAVAAFILGCETGTNTPVRQVAADFTGVYQNGGKPLAPAQSGSAVTTLNLNQTGDKLEAFDNFQVLWSGTIGEVFISSSGGATAPFTLQGTNTLGTAVTISGEFSGQNSGSAGVGTMSGTWIEPTLFSSFFAQGAISAINTNNGGGTSTNTAALTATASPSSLLANGQTSTLTANGGTAPFTWVSGNIGLGTVGSSGQTVTYTRVNSGNNTVTVTDGQGSNAFVTITQP